MSPAKTSHFQCSPPLRKRIARVLGLASVLIFTSSPLYAANQAQMDSIRQSIQALDSARKTAIQEIETMSMPSSEVSDYRDFVVYLNTRIVTYCRELAEQEGVAATEGLPCPAGPMMSGAEGTPMPTEEEIIYTIGPGTAETRTQAERTAEIDGSFSAALGEFDEMLLKEEEKVASRVPSQRESGRSDSSGQSSSSGSSGSDGAGETGSGEEGEAGEQGTGTAGDSSTDGRAEGQAGQAGASANKQSSAGAGDSNVDHSAYGAPGGKLPPPEDDDIVARQLREAAEKEPDPELKKKLWEEYWKYKGVSKKGK